MAKILQEIRFDQQTDLVNVSFVMRSDYLQPAVITAELGIEPSWAFSKGEIYFARSINPETKEIILVQAKRPWGVWAIDTKSLESNKVVLNHILHLINLLEPKFKEVSKYLEQEEKYHIRFTIQWTPIEDYGGSYEIDSEILMRMSKLSHYIEFSFLS